MKVLVFDAETTKNLNFCFLHLHVSDHGQSMYTLFMIVAGLLAKISPEIAFFSRVHRGVNGAVPGSRELLAISQCTIDAEAGRRMYIL